jgi:outer membrane murein-binding lipoprotein Lpp
LNTLAAIQQRILAANRILEANKTLNGQFEPLSKDISALRSELEAVQSGYPNARRGANVNNPPEKICQEFGGRASRLAASARENSMRFESELDQFGVQLCDHPAGRAYYQDRYNVCIKSDSRGSAYCLQWSGCARLVTPKP